MAAPIDRTDAADGRIPLEARIDGTLAQGWRITIPLRAERVDVDRQTVVREELIARPRTVASIKRVEATVAHEALWVERQGSVEAPRVEPAGDLEATQRIVDR
jgi:uncharacterized protein (TIGR02271 family)